MNGEREGRGCDASVSRSLFFISRTWGSKWNARASAMSMDGDVIRSALWRYRIGFGVSGIGRSLEGENVWDSPVLRARSLPMVAPTSHARVPVWWHGCPVGCCLDNGSKASLCGLVRLVERVTSWVSIALRVARRAWLHGPSDRRHEGNTASGP